MVSNPKELSENEAREAVRVNGGNPVARQRVQAKPQAPPQAAPVRPRVQGVAVPPSPGGINLGHAPVRLPAGGFNGASMMARSVFDEAVRGAGAQVYQVPVRMGASPLQPVVIAEHAAPAGPTRPVVTAYAALGQEGQGTPPPQANQERTAVERVIKRELPPVGLTREEAAAIASALTPALEASARALQEGIVCGPVDSVVIQEVRLLRDYLDRFALVASGEERSERLSADDFSMIDEVLACQAIVEQVLGAKQDKTTALLVGGLVVGAVVLIIAS